MGAVKERKKKKKKLIRQKLNKNLKHVAKILSKYKDLTKNKKNKSKESSSASASSNLNDEDIVKIVNPAKFNWEEFAKMRERMFGDLQCLVKENWNQNSSVKLTGGEVQDLSLKLEQRALLACMQSDIYKSAISEIMTGVREATVKKQLHPQVEKLFTNVWHSQQNMKVKVEPAVLEIPCPHTALSKIEKRTNSQSPRIQLYRNPSPEPTEPPVEPPEPPEPPESCFDAVSYDIGTKCNFEEKSERMEKTESYVEDVTSTTIDPDVVEPEEKDEDDDHDQNEELDNLMRILEGTDEENRCDLDTRVKQMESLFLGVSVSHSQSYEGNKHFTNDLSGKPYAKMWSIERYIFMYRIIARMSRLNTISYKNARNTFLTLFGPDSDEENEEHFDDYEKFTSNCVRRILPTVARHLMPYYKARQVCGGSFVFKNLVRRIAQSMVDQNYYPNDVEIKIFVDRFFPSGQRYMDVGDVWCFTLEE